MSAIMCGPMHVSCLSEMFVINAVIASKLNYTLYMAECSSDTKQSNGYPDGGVSCNGVGLSQILIRLQISDERELLS